MRLNVRWSAVVSADDVTNLTSYPRWGKEFLVIFNIYKCVACDHTLTLTVFLFNENYTSWSVSVAHFDGKTAVEKEETYIECDSVIRYIRTEFKSNGSEFMSYEMSQYTMIHFAREFRPIYRGKHKKDKCG